MKLLSGAKNVELRKNRELDGLVDYELLKKLRRAIDLKSDIIWQLISDMVSQ